MMTCLPATDHAVERDDRQEAVRQARATSLLEGAVLDDAGVAVLERWVDGELGDEQLIQEMGCLPLS